MTMLRCTLPALTMVLLLACGGSSHPPAPSPTSEPSGASSLQYQDPAGTGWRLVRNAADSTPACLALDLVGPAGTLARGVGLTLGLDSDTLAYEKYADGSYLKERGVFELADVAGPWANPDSPRLLVAGVKGERLMLGIYQKNAEFSAKDCARSLIQCRVKLKPGASPWRSVRFQVLKAQILPSDISNPEARLEPIDVAVGVVSSR